MTTDGSVEQYYREQLHGLIWSGFFDESDFRQYLEDLEYDEDGRPLSGMLEQLGQTEIAAKRAEEQTWPAVTDCDRLHTVFEELDRQGILALENAGTTTSDAHADAWTMIEAAPAEQYRGYCFYHGQDVERAVGGMPLFIGFDAVAQGLEAKQAVGEHVAAALRDAGFEVDWNGDPETRMSIAGMDWKRRTAWEDRPKKGWLKRFLAD